MNGWFDDFESLYDMYDHDEPTLTVDNYIYCIQQYGTKDSPRKIHVSITDLNKVPKDANCYNPKYEIECKDFNNSFELINNFVLMNGKTIAQMMCDANEWDYSILPVYPDWLTPLGEIKPVEEITDKEFADIEKSCDEITDYLWEKDKDEMMRDGDLDGLRMYAEAEMEVENLSDKEFQKWIKKETHKHDDK